MPGWLIGIARNKVLEALRRRQLHLIDDERQPATEMISPDAIDALSDRLLLADALRLLTPRAKMLVTMAFSEQLSHREIAERTSLPIGTVKSDIRRGLERLRRHLERTDG